MNTYPRHIVQSFDEDLARVHRQVVEMGAFVVTQLEKLIAAMGDQDSAAAYGITKRKGQINQMEVECDTEIFVLLARRCPVARDLRIVMTASKIVSCLERVGDALTKVAHVLLEQLQQKGAKLIAPSEFTLTSGARTLAILVRALRSYELLDVASARQILDQHSAPRMELDVTMRQLMSAIESQPLNESVSQILILKSLDRISDLAIEIARDMVALGEDEP
jgi:phosphate transport system protein